MKYKTFIHLCFACTPAEEKPDNDPDGDGLTNARKSLGTDKNADSDGDGKVIV